MRCLSVVCVLCRFDVRSVSGVCASLFSSNAVGMRQASKRTMNAHMTNKKRTRYYQNGQLTDMERIEICFRKSTGICFRVLNIQQTPFIQEMAIS